MVHIHARLDAYDLFLRAFHDMQLGQDAHEKQKDRLHQRPVQRHQQNQRNGQKVDAVADIDKQLDLRQLLVDKILVKRPQQCGDDHQHNLQRQKLDGQRGGGDRHGNFVLAQVIDLHRLAAAGAGVMLQ